MNYKRRASLGILAEKIFKYLKINNKKIFGKC